MSNINEHRSSSTHRQVLSSQHDYAIVARLTLIRTDFDPNRYHSGRWLRLDKQQIEARHVNFDFTKLCDRVVACSSGAKDYIQCVKIEGGFDRAFLFKLDNGASLVARVPFSIAGPARLTTNSEVATMEYGQTL